MRHLVVALLLFLWPHQLPAQVLGAEQDAWVKSFVRQLVHEVERCSLAANAKDREGPAKVQVDVDERGKVRRLVVLDDLPKTDVGKCIAAFRAADLPSAKFSGGKTLRLEFAFHPWANRAKRVWADVRKEFQASGAEAALSKCVKDAGADRPKELTLAVEIALDGRVAPRGDAANVNETCVREALQPLQFPASENLFRVEYTWTSAAKPRTARGFVVRPSECAVEGYPCSWAEADGARVLLGNDYVKKLGERIDCANPGPAVAWLEKQPHVRWVRTDGCHVSLLVDGARPMSFFGK